MNPDASQRHHELERLDWLAFLYIADELEAEQVVEFEARLDADQNVRDAVAQAVAETDLLNAALTQNLAQPASLSTVAKRSRPAPRRRAWLVPATLLTAASGLLLVALTWNAWSPNPRPASAEELADAWVNTLVSLDQNELEEFITDDIKSVELDDATDSWMFAALDEMEKEMETSMPVDPMELPETNQGDLQCLE